MNKKQLQEAVEIAIDVSHECDANDQQAYPAAGYERRFRRYQSFVRSLRTLIKDENRAIAALIDEFQDQVLHDKNLRLEEAVKSKEKPE